MVKKFIQKYFPPMVNAGRRRDIITFEQKEIETMREAWARFKRLVCNCPHNDIPDCVQMEIFYGELNHLLQSVVNASVAGGLMDKTYIEPMTILERISRNTDEWVDDGYGTRSMDRRKTQTRMVEADVALSLAAQMATVTSLLKTMAINNDTLNVAQMNVMN